MNWQSIFEAIPGAYYLLLDGVGKLSIIVNAGKDVIYNGSVEVSGRLAVQFPVHPTDTDLRLRMSGEAKMNKEPLLVHSSGAVWPVVPVKKPVLKEV